MSQSRVGKNLRYRGQKWSLLSAQMPTELPHRMLVAQQSASILQLLYHTRHTVLALFGHVLSITLFVNIQWLIRPLFAIGIRMNFRWHHSILFLDILYCPENSEGQPNTPHCQTPATLFFFLKKEGNRNFVLHIWKHLGHFLLTENTLRHQIAEFQGQNIDLKRILSCL